MTVVIQIAGILFLFIIILLFSCDFLGHGVISDLDSEAKLNKINENPKKFRISVILLIIENVTIIALSIMLFIAFRSYSLVLGILWVVFRIAESSIQLYDKKNYWGLLNIAKEYAEVNNERKKESIDAGLNSLKRKINIFTISQLLFSLGTLAYSLMFVIYEAIPLYIGWFGIATSIVYGAGHTVKLVKPKFEILWKIGALLVFIFELGIGIYLLFYPLFS